METSSYSVLYSLRFSTTITNSNKFYYRIPPRSNYNFSLGPSFSFTPTRKFNFLRKYLQPSGFAPFCSPPSSPNQNPSPEFAVLLEVDGVLMDAYRIGNRQAFNIAFQKLGLDCANWTEPVYLDLRRKSAGDEERMLILYFNQIGWPTSLPTSEKGTFIKNVLREKKIAMDEFMMSESSPLRPGVVDFIDDASNDGIPVVILTAYGKSEENIARSIVDKLGHERTSKIKIVGNMEVEKSLYGQLVLGSGLLSGIDEELAKEARKAVSAEKQKIAEEVASMLKLSVQIDTSSTESLVKIVAALRAAAEYAGVPVNNCVLIAGSQSGVAAAGQIGMPCVVLRSR
ncbi:uncharacterized protein LOC110602956 isoform X3 [Manihot esculenta]|uniref:uncharacterized protein LOC110602956 isoform X3 n=1 Tax=Manihot esculenta TaxID=3983 RepID=UPI000B5D75F2|nr:uncharacterized protein LOC110602956 isoform X3 [Manihot esculenta]